MVFHSWPNFFACILSAYDYVPRMANILAVDDSEPMRKLVALVLEKAGHKVSLAENGADALEQFRGKPFDLVVTDINMPLMSGFELIRAIREFNDTIPILALTTESDDGLRKKGSELGANGWIVKPFRPVPFLELIEQVL
jgi:two-component system, chemotaxis family, chemotaxis protein CheY